MISYMVTGFQNGEKVNLKIKSDDEKSAISKVKKLYKLSEVIAICLYEDFEKKDSEIKNPKSYYSSRPVIRGHRARKYGGM